MQFLASLFWAAARLYEVCWLLFRGGTGGLLLNATCVRLFATLKTVVSAGTCGRRGTTTFVSKKKEFFKLIS